MLNIFKSHKEIKENIQKIVDLVSHTYGKKGIAVGRYESDFTTGQYIGEVLTYDDGFEALKSIKGEKIEEKLAITLLQSNAYRVANIAGDGTTTSCLLLNHLYQSIDFDKPIYQQKKDMQSSRERILSALSKYRVDTTTDEQMEKLANSIAKNEKIAKNVSRIFKETNGIGNVLPKMLISKEEDLFEIEEGIPIKNLLLLPELNINETKELKCAVMITDAPVLKLSNLDLKQLAIRFASTNIEALIFFCLDLSQEAKSEVILHNFTAKQNGLPYLLPLVPDYKNNQDEMISVLCNKFNIYKTVNGEEMDGNFSIKEGLRFSHEYFQDTQFGICKALVNYSKYAEESKIIFTETNEKTERIEKLILLLTNLREKSTGDNYKKITDLLSIAIGKYITLEICGSTNSECSEKWERYDDTLKGYKSATQFGLVKGGGQLWNSLLEDPLLEETEKRLAQSIIDKLDSNFSLDLESEIYDTYQSVEVALDVSYSTVISNIVPYYTSGDVK